MAGECNFSGTRPSLLQRDERNQFSERYIAPERQTLSVGSSYHVRHGRSGGYRSRNTDKGVGQAQRMAATELHRSLLSDHLQAPLLGQKRKKEAQHVALDESLHSRPDTSTPYDSLTAREGLGLLQKLLKELPQTQQDIVQLREIEGKSYKEIAAILNLSEEQVKVYLFRARQRIKQKYTEIQGYGL